MAFAKNFAEKAAPSVGQIEVELLNESTVCTDATVVTVNGKQAYIRNFSSANAVLYTAMEKKDIEALDAERDLRKSKNRQKISGGFRKQSGNEMYCRIMSIIETCKRKEMQVIESIRKIFDGTPAIY